MSDLLDLDAEDAGIRHFHTATADLVAVSATISEVRAVSAQTSPAPVHWTTKAACRGRTRLFYAEDYFSQRIAVAVCRDCSVRRECLDDLRADERTGGRFGVRGGMTAEQRRRAWG